MFCKKLAIFGNFWYIQGGQKKGIITLIQEIFKHFYILLFCAEFHEESKYEKVIGPNRARKKVTGQFVEAGISIKITIFVLDNVRNGIV